MTLDPSDFINPPIISDQTNATFTNGLLTQNPNVNHPVTYAAGTATAYCNTAYIDGHVETRFIRIDKQPSFYEDGVWAGGVQVYWFR